ncbi:MAG: DUF3043 domain-containing protein [Angustibacter sp.]
MFGRGKPSTTAAANPAAPATTSASAAGKNRPTPRRRDAEAARRQPLVPAGRGAARVKGPQGRAARRQARLDGKEQRIRSRERMLAGDEQFLLARDRGPVRRFARDMVDARRNIGELMLPVMLVVLALSIIGNGGRAAGAGVYLAVLLLTYGLVLVALVDSVVLTRRLKRALRERFGPDVVTKGVGFYAAMRALQVRRLRVPRPTVQRGEYPT